MKLYSCILVLFLLISSGTEMKEVKAARCMEVLDPNGCILPSCKQRCLQEKNGNGVCVPNRNGGYECICYYNC
ncbi:unnamed protein product, partial [Vitis vinifera]|uniref:Uncharacterized protein n=1 Tax=Vitis vinifera TaxID=29760 RepID=D7TYF8_VITVI